MLDVIREFRREESPQLLELHPWLRYLAEAGELHINLEHFVSIAQARQGNPLLDYVERVAEILASLQLSFWERETLELVCRWKETAKGGSYQTRKSLLQRGVNLFIHNRGSAEIFWSSLSPAEQTASMHVVRTLIDTHGYVGQYLRGETPLSANAPLYGLVREGLVRADELARLLHALNHCVIGALSESLWNRVEKDVALVIEQIVTGACHDDLPVKERFRRLRARAIANGESFDAEWDRLTGDPVIQRELHRVAPLHLWYPEPATSDFSLEEVTKMFLLILRDPVVGTITHLTFEPMMHSLYTDRDGHKEVHVLRKRIIEHYLRGFSVDSILRGDPSPQLVAGSRPRVRHHVTPYQEVAGTAQFDFALSEYGERLVALCEAAGAADELAAIHLLYAHFGLTHGQLDRLTNEQKYLQEMNSAAADKLALLAHVSGTRVLDVGPGGGVLLNLIDDHRPDLYVMGVDLSQDRVAALQREKVRSKRRWDAMTGDATRLTEYVRPGEYSTIIFNAILHEIYSIDFSLEPVRQVLQQAFAVLRPGGRILVRDGILTEPTGRVVYLQFTTSEWIDRLYRFQLDFKGRDIQITRTGHNEVAMPVNDAKEALSCLTWGLEAYPLEVQEQRHYLTPSGWRDAVAEWLGPDARVVELRSYLQPGYTLALQPHVRILNDHREPIPFPDFTAVVVIERVS